MNPDTTDNFVDWVTGDYDESTNVGSVAGANTNLFGSSDFIHVNSLGYQVMAYQWFQAMKEVGVVPEPSSVLLLLSGSAMLFMSQGSKPRHSVSTRFS